MTEAGTLKRWRLAPPVTDHALARHARVPALVADMLARRHAADPDRAAKFLAPRLTDLHDPALLPGAARAAERIVQAVHDRQPIVIYGDYDVDGVTAGSILWHTLRLLGADVRSYIPHRIDEGYGLNCEAIAQLCDAPGGKPLIVSVDCGITAVEPAKIAQQAQVDLIITDHHEFDPAALPAAHTLVHPRLAGDGEAYPFDALCGAGVAFKLAWQIARTHCGSDRLPEVMRELVLDLLSLAALGTVADVVPLVDENRIITRFGLGQIKRTRFAGLNALIDATDLRGEKIDAYHVGFVLGPRLNACGRMGHAREAMRLLTDAEGDDAAQLARFLTQENDRRRATERRIFEQAKQMVLDRGYDSADSRAIVVGSEDWHPGVIGIVASRLVEAFARPVVMLSFQNGEAHGSARSVEGVSIHQALGACASHLRSFGGHAMAAGMRLDVAGVDAFRDALIEQVNTMLAPEDLVGVLDVEALCELDAIDLPLVEQIDRLAPFGRANPRPVLCVRGAQLARPAQRMGGGGKHMSMSLRQGQRIVRAAAFGMGEFADDLPAGATIDVCFEPKVNDWRGNRTAEMIVKDFKIVSAAAHGATSGARHEDDAR